ncbi:ABC transporter permease [Plebeiibacterium sediminum]|uniref:ABC transporter permease n=1 Tax=Plebeiibacterium sediminum TaxID=2992112 RepID=A0AAE3M4K3_9BACT|nr:FtsX-like permease family protein [Plebeiobacterium sediminum]MCW3786732.1 ABC transporter permease [Plebeiobacterium sediminum]
MILKIAWRNIWRNPVRSWIVIGALIVGMYAGVFSTTFMYGWMMQRLRAGIETETSHIQIHQPGFRLAEDINKYFDENQLLDKIETLPDVKSASGRIIVSAMAASAEKATGIQIIGVDPIKDSMVVDVSKKIVEGKWFEGINRNPVVIGQKLAEQLKLKLRSKIILRFQNCKGDFTGGAFRVAGIFKTNNTGYDEANVFVQKSDLALLVNLPAGKIHEVVIRCADPTIVDDVKNQIDGFVENLQVESWKEISPELGYLTETMNAYMYVFVGIILLALGFSIVNTMLMVVMERVHELGMLMAVGMSRKQIFSMIVFETLFLSLFGGFIGISIGVLTTKLTAQTGIDLSMWAEGLSEMGYASVIYPEYNLQMVLSVSALVIATGLISAIYPAWKALKLHPSQALQSV